MQQQNSEVARLLAQINSEYEAARQGLTGLAAVASHKDITTRADNLTHLVRQGKHEEAFRLWNDADRGGARPGTCNDCSGITSNGVLCHQS